MILRPPTFTPGVDNAARQWKQRVDRGGGVWIAREERERDEIACGTNLFDKLMEPNWTVIPPSISPC